MSRRGIRRLRRETTSDSAKTVQVLLMRSPLAPPRRARRPSFPISSSGISSACDMISRNRPVPAAQRSFITKSLTKPSRTEMILVSWPPMSMTVSVPGKRNEAPRAWQVISVSAAAANETFLRP